LGCGAILYFGLLIYCIIDHQPIVDGAADDFFHKYDFGLDHFHMEGSLIYDSDWMRRFLVFAEKLYKNRLGHAGYGNAVDAWHTVF
jgi:hypothetical protein